MFQAHQWIDNNTSELYFEILGELGPEKALTPCTEVHTTTAGHRDRVRKGHCLLAIVNRCFICYIMPIK